MTHLAAKAGSASSFRHSYLAPCKPIPIQRIAPDLQLVIAVGTDHEKTRLFMLERQIPKTAKTLDFTKVKGQVD